MQRFLLCLEGSKRHVILCELFIFPNPLDKIALKNVIVKTARAVR